MKFPINFFSRKQIESIQYKKIKKILHHAYNNSLFYRNLYDVNNFHPDLFKSMDDIDKIPIVRRNDLRNAPVEQIVTCKNLKSLHLHTTSGSSGISIRYYFSRLEELQKNYYVLRSYLMAGQKITAKTVALRDPIDITKPNFLQKIGLIRYEYYNIYDPIENIYNNIKKNNPKKIEILKGYPSDLVNLATLVEKYNFDFPKVDIIYSDSEVLDQASREYISNIFKCPILDFYASVECGMIAFQTPHSKKYSINEDAVLLETIKKGILSEVVITNLRNKTFPIIRYEIGDAIEFGNSSIDSYTGFKTLENIYGKYLDFILLPDNTIVSPHVPKQELTHAKGIAKFKLVQKQIDLIDLFIQKNNDFNDNSEKEILNKLNISFKNLVKINIYYVEKLDRGDKRKFKCIESIVAQDFLSRHK